MKYRYFFTLSLLLFVAVPASAQSNFVADFLSKYHPPLEAAPRRIRRRRWFNSFRLGKSRSCLATL